MDSREECEFPDWLEAVVEACGQLLGNWLLTSTHATLETAKWAPSYSQLLGKIVYCLISWQVVVRLLPVARGNSRDMIWGTNLHLLCKCWWLFQSANDQSDHKETQEPVRKYTFFLHVQTLPGCGHSRWSVCDWRQKHDWSGPGLWTALESIVYILSQGGSVAINQCMGYCCVSINQLWRRTKWNWLLKTMKSVHSSDCHRFLISEIFFFILSISNCILWGLRG